MRIIIIDDDKGFIEKFKKDLYNYFYELCDDNHFEILSSNFSEFNFSIIYDFIFLDIDLITDNGIEIAKKIKSFNIEAKIIFVTNHPNLIFNTLSIQPFFFIRKHEYAKDIQIFFNLVDKQFKTKDLITIKRFGEKQVIFVNDIIYIEANDRLLNIHTLDYTYQDSRYLKDFMLELNDQTFVQIHRSYVVNLNHVLKRSASKVTLLGNTVLELGRAYKNTFNQKYEEVLLQWIFLTFSSI